MQSSLFASQSSFYIPKKTFRRDVLEGTVLSSSSLRNKVLRSQKLSLTAFLFFGLPKSLASGLPFPCRLSAQYVGFLCGFLQALSYRLSILPMEETRLPFPIYKYQLKLFPSNLPTISTRPNFSNLINIPQ